MLDFQELVDAVASVAMATGLFDTVNTHEPKAPPNSNMTCSIWPSDIRSASSSGLNAVSGLIEMTVRAQTPSLQQPADQIDPLMMQAVGTLMAAFGAGFTLGGLVREVDLLGQHSQGLRAKPGYVKQNETVYRVFDVMLPLIVNDLYPEEP